MFKPFGARSRLPRSSLANSWCREATREAIVQGGLMAAGLAFGGAIVNFAYSVWEPDKALHWSAWWIIPFVLGSIFSVFASRAPLTRGSSPVAAVAYAFGFFLGGGLVLWLQL